MKIVSRFETRGNIELLSQKPIAVFASQNTPNEIFRDAESLFEKLCDLPVSIAGGWQAPLEKKLLQKTNKRMKANIIFYSARDISKIKMTKHLADLDNENKLLVISAQSRQSRPSKTDVDKRDNLMFSQVAAILFFYIAEGGRLEKYFNDLISAKFPVYLFEHELNSPFLTSDCMPINEDNLDLYLP